MKSDVWAFFENISNKFKFHQNRTRIADTLHEALCIFGACCWPLTLPSGVPSGACTGSFPGVTCGRDVLLTTHPLLVPRSRKS